MDPEADLEATRQLWEAADPVQQGLVEMAGLAKPQETTFELAQLGETLPGENPGSTRQPRNS